MNERIPLLLPIAIVLAGIILGIAIYVVRVGEALPSESEDTSFMRPVGPEDHSIGNPDAPVVVVEYSDIDCAYCKEFQETMSQLMAEYGPEGNVLWVYRHYPIIESHPDSALHAEAAECAAAQGGDNAFFRFVDALQQEAPGERSFNPSGYGRVAESLGLSKEALESCVAGSEFEQKVSDDFDNGVVIGVRGTPYSVILVRGGESIPVSGTVPYEAMKQIIDVAIERAQAVPTP